MRSSATVPLAARLLLLGLLPLAAPVHGEAAVQVSAPMEMRSPSPVPPDQAWPQLFQAEAQLLLDGEPLLQEEIFGPTTVVVELADQAQLLAALHALGGQLTATLIGELSDLAEAAPLVAVLEQKAGRVLVNGYPTGVEVCDAMVHGGPYPATSDSRGTSVGTLAIDRFLRPVCYQNFPDALLPEALRDANPLQLLRLVDGQPSRDPIC